MATHPDGLMELLPAIYRLRDAERGGDTLRALLGIIGEQVHVVEDDIHRLYDNWFIETCEPWAVPYIADLLGYQLLAENRQVVPRREVANLIKHRRRKGTLALLEELANDIAGWPARAVEFYSLLAWTQNLNLQHPRRGGTANLRDENRMDRVDGPFDDLAHTIDVRLPDSRLTGGKYSIPSVGLFVWRLKAYSVTECLAYCREQDRAGCYTFSILGNDAPLFTRPLPEPAPEHVAEEPNVPAPIRQLALQRDLHERIDDDRASRVYYGAGRSFQIWRGAPDDIRPSPETLVPASRIVVADLDRWYYEPPEGYVAVDPVRGRIVFPTSDLPPADVWVSYHYGFSSDMGGGEYYRRLTEPSGARFYQVSQQDKVAGAFRTVQEALAAWRRDKPEHAIIEIGDSGVYTGPLEVRFAGVQSLQIRAAQGTRPVLRMLDEHVARVDTMANAGGGGRLTLDGLLIFGRGLTLAGDYACVTIRHCTLVPGWGLESDCTPKLPQKPSIVTRRFRGKLRIDHSIVGPIHVFEDEVREDPIEVEIRDSIVDSTGPRLPAIGAPPNRWAHASLTILRSTVFGTIDTHAMVLGENSIFLGRIHVARRQTGCIRFSYVAPLSRTPRRFHCQPDLVGPGRPARRVEPLFLSQRYGTPTYAQLADGCAPEILRGADDESEMGVFHDLFQPQREALLQIRLDEYVPAGTHAGLIHAT
jgi:hypothetical protein